MIPFYFWLAAVYLLDIATKVAVRRFMPLGDEIHLLPVFSLVHVQNTGIAFGMFPGKNLFFIAVGLLLSVGIFIYARRLFQEDRLSCYTLGVVLGGAWGNLTDRILYGHVTDFLDFFIGTHHWPAFNVADSAICIGAGILFIRSFRKQKA